MAKYKGAYLHLRADELCEELLANAWQGLPVHLQGDLCEVVLGCANQAGEDSRNIARQSSLLAGLPPSVPALTLNQLCGSGLAAVAFAMQGIASGMGVLYLAGGVEHMSRSPLAYLPPFVEPTSQLEDSTFGWRFSNPRFEGLNYKVNHTQQAENVAKTLGISREAQEAYALKSHKKAAWAWEQGLFNAECRPLANQSLQTDEGIRGQLSPEVLARLKPLLAGNKNLLGANDCKPSITAATASPFSDGACVLSLAQGEWARQHHLPVLARLRGFALVATHPQEQHTAGVLATQALLKANGLKAQQLDAIEWHDNFAATSLASLQALHLEAEEPHWNAWGGALALGAPMGMASARLVVTLAHRLQAMRLQGQLQSGLGLAALSVGMGQGMALLLEAF